MDKDVIICRCEEITYGEVLGAIEDGALTVAGVKRRIGTGMGICQGKYCEKLISQIISDVTGIKLEEIHPDTKRPPTRPIEVKVFFED